MLAFMFVFLVYFLKCKIKGYEKKSNNHMVIDIGVLYECW